MDLSKRLGDILPHRILIFRALQLGDLLCAVPALRALRSALPEADITLVGLPWSEIFVERFHHYIDDFIEFPGIPGFPEREPQIEAFPAFLRTVQEQKFDLALQMQGSGAIANTLIVLFGARLSAGYYLPDQYCPDEARFLPYPDLEPEVWRHLRLMEFLGIPLQGDHLEFPILEQDWIEFQQLQAQRQLEPGGYMCIHPGARAAARRWPAENFAIVADALSEKGLQVVLTGSEAERALLDQVAGKMKTPAVNLAGATSLGALAALLSCARLLVCNDTGVSHLADARDIPSIVLFSASDPSRWAPLNRDLHRVLDGAASVPPTAVVEEAEDLLAKDAEDARA
jgi:ADP-heptose:LPS heptosyltransferase